ncbi:MAG: hypothetical protein Q9181_008179 [Wetmoreana brouardii]
MFGLEDHAASLLSTYEIDEPTGMGSTALIKAASCGHPNLVRIFMSMKADPTRNNWYGTALHAAAEAGEVDSIHQLLAAGVDVNIQDKHGRVPLLCAAGSGNTNAMRALLEGGADVNYSWENEATALCVMVGFHERPDVIRTLLSYHADPNIPNAFGHVPLHIIANSCDEEDDQEVAQLLLEHGAEINLPDEQGRTALHIAAAANNVNLMHLFLEQGADVNAKAVGGITALHAAVIASNVEAIQILLDNGAKMGLLHEKGQAAQDLSLMGSWEIVQLLLEAGVDPAADVINADRAFEMWHNFHYGKKLQRIQKSLRFARHRQWRRSMTRGR